MNEAAKQLLFSLLGEFEEYVDEEPNMTHQDLDILQKCNGVLELFERLQELHT